MRKITLLFATLFLLSCSAVQADTFDPAKLPVTKQTVSGKYLSAKEALEMKGNNPATVLFVDVRTAAETEYVGIADQVDINIPFMQDDYSTWDSKKERFLMNPNSSFTLKVAEALQVRGLKNSDAVVLICRSGDRSAGAANLLSQAGYTNVYSVYDGFEGDMAKEGVNKGRRLVNGWKNAGLPWGYSLNKERAYFSTR
ncbi:rhodanese-like domain-containing protein [Pelodictyon phaeoclathratiforme]|jgi:rhodanese-related sulfurtransferase|uniref:Rhodanese domain protein n=1 Tax=Pelodictyon phaeoclathratiforme (strain DSM 5477 / BU-1) TaxID=324925 RepID=B4SEA5_PELPB|nr:rhodanese-like domain-containing protein [Pelodictyon phaeoclathratiforme]ACF44524.1 Rhodanese domain protein [Pelodictyon phaeoclathratiforme BU-1]MBV5290136.1 sulfurtransferase [Pelodictyon phaeoclathratiforme]